MFFTWGGALTEVKRLNENCKHTSYSMSKRWYGWAIVEDPIFVPYNRKEEIKLNKFIVMYPHPAALRHVAEKAAQQAKDVIVTPAQIDQYVQNLVKSAFRPQGFDQFTCLKLVCDRVPGAFSHMAEEIYQVDDQNNLKSIKSRIGSRESNLAAYIALHDVYPTLTITVGSKDAQ